MTKARLAELKALRKANNADAVNIDSIVEQYASSTDAYAYLAELTERELIATKGWLHKQDIELAYAKTKSKLTYEVNKGLAELLD